MSASEFEESPRLQETYLSIEQLIEILPGTYRGYWANLRWSGKGPVYIKLGKRILYPKSKLEAWLDSKERTQSGTDNPV